MVITQAGRPLRKPLPCLLAEPLATLQFDCMPLAVLETDSFHAAVMRQRPGQTGGGILASGKQYKGRLTVSHG